MMARSTKSSNQRPDTLMQDRTSAVSIKVLLQRTAGPYIWVISGGDDRHRAASQCPLEPVVRLCADRERSDRGTFSVSRRKFPGGFIILQDGKLLPVKSIGVVTVALQLPHCVVEGSRQ